MKINILFLNWNSSDDVLDSFFNAFATLYYFIEYIKYFVYMVLFLSSILFISQSRTGLVVTAIILFIFLYNELSLKKFFTKNIKLLFFFFLFFLAIIFYNLDVIETTSKIFLSLFPDNPGDASSSIRYIQSYVVINFLNDNPSNWFIGTGQLSKHWHNGYDGFFAYLYPFDIGLLGGVFKYGFIGLIFLFVIPVIFIIRTIRKIDTRNENNYFVLTLKYSLIQTVIVSLAAGGMLHNYSSYIVILFILLAHLKVQERLYAK